MTIEYALTRMEVVAGFFLSLRSSPRYAAFLVVIVSALFILVPQVGDGFSHPFTMRDAGSAVLGLMCTFVLILPLVVFMRAKTGMRLLTISPGGISTKIGSLQGRITWQQIKTVQEKDDYILIAAASGNAFFIPNRTFATRYQKDEFATKALAWARASRANAG